MDNELVSLTSNEFVIILVDMKKVTLTLLSSDNRIFSNVLILDFSI